MTEITGLPNIRPDWLFDFANSGRVDPRIQYTRAFGATHWGADGKLRVVSANTPRIDHDPQTGECLGLLVESGATNLITNSLTLGDKVAGGNTVVADGVVSIDGVTPSVRVAATAESFSSLAQYNIPVTPGTYTHSVYYCGFEKPEGGTLLYSSELQEDGSAIIKWLSFLDPRVIADGKWRRYEMSVTHKSAGLTLAHVAVDTGPGVHVYLCGEQYERGSKATSLILTPSMTAATRATDNYRAVLRRGSSFSVVVSAEKYEFSGTYPRYFSLSDGSYDDEIGLVVGDGTLVLARSDDQGIASVNIGAVGHGDVRGALSYDAFAHVAAAVLNGGPAGALTVTGLAGNQLGIGQTFDGNDVVSAHIKHIALYPAALTVGQLQRLTS